MNTRNINNRTFGYNHSRKARAARKLARMAALAAFVVVAAVMLVLLGKGLIRTNAEVQEGTDKFYKSVTVKAGDSLWTIADTYKPAGASTVSYVKELKSINNLRSDNIRSGADLIVFYYVNE